MTQAPDQRPEQNGTSGGPENRLGVDAADSICPVQPPACRFSPDWLGTVEHRAICAACVGGGEDV
jgi:hypothetical protein